MKLAFVVLSILLLSLAPTPPSTATVDPADLIIKNGNIYTVSEKHPHAEAVAVKADRIVFVGSNAEVQKFKGPHTRVVDLQGATVVPGLTDAHHHLYGVGYREMTL